MKNLRIIQSCIYNGEHTEAGTILKNIDNGVAAELVVNSRAVEINESDISAAESPAKIKIKIGWSDEVENRDSAPEDRDPKTVKRTITQKGAK